MNTCTIVGTVTRVSTGQSKTGKPCTFVAVEVSRPYQDKVYKTRFDVSVYGQEAAAAAQLVKGTLVGVIGEVSADTNEYQGKTYARLKIVGKVTSLSSAPVQLQQPAEAPRQAVLPVAQTASQPQEDDVPF